ncbi:MAG: hypothetical protein GYA58_00490 [Anaerolineaceae bacterium]|nr:hypothetical protein [Anaerolineaceae bacterium]
MQEHKDFQQSLNTNVHLGLMAVSFSVIITCLQLDTLDSDLKLALYLFSLILPINVYYGFLSNVIEGSFQRRRKRLLISERISTILMFATLLFAVFGLYLIMSYFDKSIPNAFMIGLLIVFFGMTISGWMSRKNTYPKRVVHQCKKISRKRK